MTKGKPSLLSVVPGSRAHLDAVVQDILNEERRLLRVGARLGVGERHAVAGAHDVRQRPVHEEVAARGAVEAHNDLRADER